MNSIDERASRIIKNAIIVDLFLSFFDIFTITTLGTITKFYSIAIIVLYICSQKSTVLLIRKNDASIAGFAWVIISAFSVLYSADPRRGLNYLLGIGLNFLLYLIAKELDWNKDDIHKMELFITIGGIALCVISLFSSVVDINSRKEIVFFGIRMDANKEASVLVCPFIFLMDYVLTRKRKIKNVICAFLLIALVIYTVIQTGSRGGMLGLGVSLLAFLWISIKKRTLSTYKIIITSVIVVALLNFGIMTKYFDSAILNRLFSNYLIDNGGGRLLLWKRAFDVFKENALLGVGLGSMMSLIGMQVHNTYLEAFCDTGILGGILFLSFIIKSLRSFARTIDPKCFSVALGMALTIFFLSSYSSNYFWIPMIYSSAVVVCKRMDRENDK